MTKWEYASTFVQLLDNDAIDRINETLDPGWEIYQVERARSSESGRIYLKRPIEEEPEYTPTNIFPEPDRVVINKEGEAVPGWKAHLSGVYMGAIFIRDDGWSLGAHPNDVDVAESLWPDKWVAVMVKTTIMSYETYKQQKAEGRKFF